MTTEHAVEFGPQSLDCAPAGVVEEVCAELHRYAVKVVERMGKHQALGFGVERGSLGGAAVPRRSDLHATDNGSSRTCAPVRVAGLSQPVIAFLLTEPGGEVEKVLTHRVEPCRRCLLEVTEFDTDLGDVAPRRTGCPESPGDISKIVLAHTGRITAATPRVASLRINALWTRAAQSVFLTTAPSFTMTAMLAAGSASRLSSVVGSPLISSMSAHAPVVISPSRADP